MATPLYKALKTNGITTYVFPSSSEDISQAYQNENYKMNFSKFALLKIDFNKADLETPFNTESLTDFTSSDLIVNHLRNYIANHEVVIQESILNNNTSFYNPTELKTVSERVFFKWLRKIGVIQFEPALPVDEYIDNIDFAIDENLQEDYFKEYVWRERNNLVSTVTVIIDNNTEVIDPDDNITKKIYELELDSYTNIKPNDLIDINCNGQSIGFTGSRTFKVYDIGSKNNIKNNIIFIYSDIQLSFTSAVITVKLIYEKVVKYIGEISSINNVQNKDKSYTEITAFIPDQNGETPDILYRIYSDSNYSPSLQYPIISSQDQPEIIGAEQFDSPFNTSPQNYPGDKYGYFDVDQKYLNSDGLKDRKSGLYYGINETSRKKTRVLESPFVYPEFDGSELDGITIDFNTAHYSKMNLSSNKISDFDTFNSKSINNKPPKDFEFNIILWYYDVKEVSSGKTNSNLYGITFLNNTEQNSLTIPTLKKLVANGTQDGLSYIFNLNLNFNISNDVVIEKYDSEKVNSLFGFELYNNVMKLVASTNESYMKNITTVSNIQNELDSLKTLLYSQTDIKSINSRIDSLYNLLNLYQRSQLKSSDSIEISLDESVSPPDLLLNSIDSRYSKLYSLKSSLMYNTVTNKVIPISISVPKNKDFLIDVLNDDTTDVLVNDNLTILLNRDLDLKQTCSIKIRGNDSLYNKKLSIVIGSNKILSNLNLPITRNLNSALTTPISKRWLKNTTVAPLNIEFRTISTFYYLYIDVAVINSFKVGDSILLENFYFEKNVNNVIISINLSDQYTITNIVNNSIVVKINNSLFGGFFNLLADNEKPNAKNLLNQPSYLTLNNGYEIDILCVSTDTDKYLISYKMY